MGWHWALTFSQATSQHANQRKMLRRGIGPQRIGSHNALIESEIAKFMLELETFQGDPFQAVQRYARSDLSILRQNSISVAGR
jgi:hypothetical protein